MPTWLLDPSVAHLNHGSFGATPREVLDRQDVDVVTIGTPDHWHCLPAVEACKAGVDVYVQKPVGVDVVEGQAMVAAARKYNKVVQVGTHDELLAASGHYATLYNTYFRHQSPEYKIPELSEDYYVAPIL